MQAKRKVLAKRPNAKLVKTANALGNSYHVIDGDERLSILPCAISPAGAWRGSHYCLVRKEQAAKARQS
jgi:hypothetical protein